MPLKEIDIHFKNKAILTKLKGDVKRKIMIVGLTWTRHMRLRSNTGAE